MSSQTKASQDLPLPLYPLHRLRHLWLLEVLKHPEDDARAKVYEEEEGAQEACEVIRDIPEGRRLVLHK